MKKKFLAKIAGGVFATALLLTGCATVSNVHNESTKMIYNGGSAVTVSGYTYFANAYTPYSSSTDFDYKANSNVSYLARVNNEQLTSDGMDFSPKVVDKVKKIVAGYQNQDMFILGDYLYFTTMNTLQYQTLQHDYSLVSLCRVKLNGDNFSKIYTTEYFSGGSFAPVGDEQNGYYWVCFTGAYTADKEYSGQIFSIKLGNSLSGASKPIVKNVLSASFANVKEDGAVDRIFYTRSENKDDRTINHVCSIDYAGKNEIEYQSSNTISFVDKLEDRVFFTTSDTLNASSTFYRDVTTITQNDVFEDGKKEFAKNNEITKIWLVCAEQGGSEHADLDKGYVYIGSNNLMYKTDKSLAQVILTSDEFSDVLFVDNDRVYYSNSTSIGRISVRSDRQKETVVSMSSIQSGQYGFDGEYVYFFSTLDSNVETEEQDEDENMYMYRVRKSGGDYQLLGKTVHKRTPKQDD